MTLSPHDRFDVAVVGSGIVGLGAAYAAARRGLRVVVVDRTDRPVGATIRNFGHLCIGAQDGPARAYGEASRGIWLRLAAEAGFWARESGTLVVARAEDERTLLEEAAAADGDDGGIRLLSPAEVTELAPVRPEVVHGGALVPGDLQVNPREAAGAIVRHLAALGVEFRFRTAVTEAGTGLVRTTRGDIAASDVVVAVNHDVDQLLPALAERAGVIRCALDMMRVSADLRSPLQAPLLTGWSLVRYRRFAGLGTATALRERLHAERPELAALDLNQMYTQLPDGTLLLGDSHHKAVQPDPFQPEAAFEAFLAEARELFDVGGMRVLERWQGVYAAAGEEFLIEEVAPRVLALAATTGIGMTTGLGLAEIETARVFGWGGSGSPDADASAGDGTQTTAIVGGAGTTATVGGIAQEENA
ncbi:TIGR03364 family FAD-dependent oxidoreductase [Microbacterium sp. MYb64]|uniref:TIGR03364 family FAD-dependent oxidoreductase n=1 Tax=Microbacterium sp. MYb64 TaxID=1848691 RepID=UPI000CFDD325|nr:TIGR03364 family FAD-dependent oxidoreductase [Microbacterium sp. MYb64]PRB03680.1 TIGR03364 family FAD-dependent oxidoreductase [Microbacterium sp. MYb64]